MSKFIAKSVVAAVGAIALMGTQAYADGLPEKYDSYGSVWHGLYVGAHAGIAWASVDVPGGGEDDDTDFIAGLQIGYNWALSDNMLYGLEADYTFVNGDVGTIRGRIGKVLGDKLIYATAGLAIPDDGDVGFVGGVGVEWDLSHRWQNVTAGVEGLYYTFSEDHRGVDYDADAFVLRGRINYRIDTASKPLK